MQSLLHKRTFYSFAFIVVNFLLFGTAFGQTSTKTWDGGANSTNWEDANNWNPNGVPSTTDAVIIENDDVVINSAATCASLTYGGGNKTSTLSISGSNSLNVTGSLTINSPTAQNRIKTIAVGNGTLTCSSIQMTNGSNGSRDCQLTIATGTVTVTGNITMDGGASRNYIQFSGAGTLNIGGNISGGELLTGTSNSTVNYNGAVQTVYPTTYQNLTLSGSGAKTMSNVSTINGSFTLQDNATATATGNLSIARDVIIGASTSFNAGNYSHTVGGNWTVNGTFTSASSTITFNGTSTQTISGTQPTQFNNVLVNNNIEVVLNQNISTNGSLTVNGVLNASTNQVTGSGNFTLSTSGTFITSNSNGVDGSIAVSGTETFPSNGGSYVFNAATTSPFPSAWTSPVNIANLTIGDNVTLNKDVNVSGTLTLNSGLLKIPSGRQLVLSSPNAIVGSGFGASKHIVTEVNSLTGAKSILQVNNLPINTPYVFPVGNGTYYLPTTLTATSTGNSFSITVFQGITENGEPNGVGLAQSLKDNAVDAVWDVNRLEGSGDVTMMLSWPDELEGSNLNTAAGDRLGISHYYLNNWDNAVGIGNNDDNTVARSGLNSFSPHAIYLMGMDFVLPVHFSNVRASQKSSGIQIDFTNLTESEVDYYEVERSLDGKAFSSIKKLSASKNNFGSAAYSWLDATAKEGRNTYRIKAVETTGKVVYSSVVSITLGAKTSGLSVYAKGGQVMLQVGSLPAGKYQIQLFSAAGQLLGAESINHAGGSLSQTTSLHTAKTGIYILNISGATRLQQKFMIQ